MVRCCSLQVFGEMSNHCFLCMENKFIFYFLLIFEKKLFKKISKEIDGFVLILSRYHICVNIIFSKHCFRTQQRVKFLNLDRILHWWQLYSDRKVTLLFFGHSATYRIKMYLITIPIFTSSYSAYITFT